jgi:hypothetical protein
MRLLHQRRGAGHRGARPRRKSLRRHKGLDGVARKVNVSLADGVKSDDTVVRRGLRCQPGRREATEDVLDVHVGRRPGHDATVATVFSKMRGAFG